MITAIFNKSKPINLVIASFIIIVGFLLAQTRQPFILEFEQILRKLLIVLVAILSILIADFIVKKNTVSKQNSYVILFFSLFFFCYWNSVDDNRLLFANFFVLLALRKIISLKSQQSISKKIFDATLWICIASLFHFWAILFLGALYFGILIYASNYYKNWLVPFVSIFAVFMIVTAYHLLFYETFFWYPDAYVNLNFETFYSLKNIGIISFLGLILLLSVVFFKASIKDKSQKNKLSYIILLVSLLVACVIVFIAPAKNLSLLIFCYFPLAVLFTAFFEKISKPWLQSILMFGILILPIILCFLE